MANRVPVLALLGLLALLGAGGIWWALLEASPERQVQRATEVELAARPGRFKVVGTAQDGRSRKKRVTVRGQPETRVRIQLTE